MTLAEFLKLTKFDLYRYAGGNTPRDFFFHCLFSPGYKYSFWMRLCTLFHYHSFSKITVFPFVWLDYYHLQTRFGIAISYKAKIGPGLYIGHHGGIVTNHQMIIGSNCNLSHGVTIGVTRRGDKMGAPIIGDNVYIGPGAKIIGRVNIGNNAAVGANCVVTKDVPDYGVVVGIPGKVISYEGSQGYINNKDYDTSLNENT